MSAIIQTTTNHLETSIDFYTRLNFKLISPNTPTLLTDGKVIIEINPDRFARAGIKLFRSSWSDLLPTLEKNHTLIKIEGGTLLSDPSGCWIYLMEGSSLAYDLTKDAFGTLGNCAGLSLETTEMTKSIALWENLGFTKVMGGIDQGYIVLTDANNTTVSVMKPMACPHSFYNPSLSYFNGKDNMAIIEKIRNLNIPITEEITHFNKEGIVDNIIIRDPEDWDFYF